MLNSEFIAAVNEIREVARAHEYSWGIAIYHVNDGPSDLVILRDSGIHEYWIDRYGDEKGPEVFEGERPDRAGTLEEILDYIGGGR